MAEKRLARAGQHAIPLILDIINSTLYLYKEVLSPEELVHMQITASNVTGWLKRGEYRIGFENFMPFGFFGCEAMEDCCRLVGPYLYREYLGQGYGKFLLDAGIRWARDRKLSALCLLADSRAQWAMSFYTLWGFEIISDDPELISRWRDGLLADQPFKKSCVLLTYDCSQDDPSV